MKKQIALYILGFVSLVITGYGTLYILRDDIMNYHKAFLGMTSDQLMLLNQHIIPLYVTLIRIAGAYMIAIGLTSFLLVTGPLRQGRRWAWWGLWTLLPIPLGTTTFYTYQIAGTIAFGPRPPYWLAAGLFFLFIVSIGFCFPRCKK
jgi:hypothetical protein